MRYNDEYPSRFKLSPTHVVAFIITIVVFVVGLNMFFPVKV